ncbi:SMC-Scp complex subunit ScpB [Pseudoxanthomonas sp. JBR18]|uniref:SMC-Scp complex subunit ScpB n=1 Tax=Pseudoxanthomonas sp. JBR18 TaxID=2969308 RepID=UPI0023060710|nr:SMC-Scp complex subunit ScpB [Pseudoxanthomonas sp. JBR18]WCE04036.1 SMC-Scp complex subunit ScpB [Pseudoxanthomonas sp. JBR18]
MPAAPVAVDQALVNRIVEAALLAANLPMTVAQLEELFPEQRPAPEGAIPTALEQLGAACADRGVELVEVASGWRYQVKGEVHGWVSRMWTERKTRYTRATLETLALIAYRQPITRGEIEQVRGVAVSSNIIQALEEREWIRVVGHRDVPGRPALFGTTRGFLDYFGLKRLDELPPLSELKDIGELDPQLPFAPATAKVAAEGQPEDTQATPVEDAGQADDASTAQASAGEAQDVQVQADTLETAPPPDDTATADASFASESPADDTPADIAQDAGDADDTQDSSQQPQEDDAAPVSSEQKP